MGMSMGNILADLDKINCLLDLKRGIVGIKFLFNENDYVRAQAKEIKGKMSYCVMVKSAGKGHPLKMKSENFGCLGAARALGAVEITESFRSGQHSLQLGLYQDFTTAKNVSKDMTYCSHKIDGILVKPLEKFSMEPDIVLIIADSYNAMRIIQGYTYNFAINSSFKFCGNQAICSECTAYPFEKNDINISLLCGGTRYKCDWGEDEIAIGIPFNKFSSLVDGICGTTNIMESNEKKKLIEGKLSQKGIKDFELEYDTAYYLASRKN